MQEPNALVSAGCMMTPTELDEMSQDLVDRLVLFRQVLNVAENGGTLRL